MGLKQKYWAVQEKAHSLFCDILEQATVISLYYLTILRYRRNAVKHYCHRHILFISYYSSPYKSIYGTQRLGKFIKYLTKMGWRVTLLTTEPAKSNEIDSKAETFPADVQVVRLPQQKAKMLRGKKYLVPDNFIHWVRPAVTTACRLATENKISIICSTAPPYSNLLAGSIASLRCGLPFVADFRDPWSLIDTGWILSTRLSKFITRSLERTLLRQTDAIVMADEFKYAVEYFALSSPSILSKVTSVLNGYDSEDIEPVNVTEQSQEKFIISYVGKFYGPESFEKLINPLIIWEQQHPNDFHNVVFEYAGPASARFDEFSFRPPYLIDHGYVTHKQAITIRKRSSLQFFTQPSFFKPHVLSGKIYEMLAALVPILAFVSPAGAVSELISRTHTGFVAPQDDHAKSAVLLKQLYNQWKDGSLTLKPDVTAIKALSRENQAHRFSTVLDGLLLE